MKNGIVYCRESRDDGGERFERIETQRDILLAFCSRNEINPIHVVLDDNESGSSFSRLLKIRHWIETENIDVLVAKDSSRIGRNQLESLEFIRFLDMHHIELALESERYDESLFGLYAWLNERRAREDGEKIRRVLRHKIEQGQLLIKASYGYRIVDKRLQIHPEQAENVRFVFESFSSGNGMSEIAGVLQKRFPSENWSCQKVSRMLKNPVYCGTYQGGKTVAERYGSKKSKKRSESEWVVIESHHPAIISNDLFEATSQRLGGTKRVANHKYAGLLICADCKAPMTRRVRKENQPFFICSSYNRWGRQVCSAHKVYESELDESIRLAIEALYKERDGHWQMKSDSGNTEERKKQIQSRIKQLDQRLERIYDDRLLDGFPQKLFEKKLKECNEQKSALIDELSKLSVQNSLTAPSGILLNRETLCTIATRIEVDSEGVICVIHE